MSSVARLRREKSALQKLSHHQSVCRHLSRVIFQLVRPMKLKARKNVSRGSVDGQTTSEPYYLGGQSGLLADSRSVRFDLQPLPLDGQIHRGLVPEDKRFTFMSRLRWRNQSCRSLGVRPVQVRL